MQPRSHTMQSCQVIVVIVVLKIEKNTEDHMQNTYF